MIIAKDEVSLVTKLSVPDGSITLQGNRHFTQSSNFTRNSYAIVSRNHHSANSSIVMVNSLYEMFDAVPDGGIVVLLKSTGAIPSSPSGCNCCSRWNVTAMATANLTLPVITSIEAPHQSNLTAK